MRKIIAMPVAEAPLAGSQGSAPPCTAPLQPQGLCQHPPPEPASAAVTWAEQTAALQCPLAGKVKTQRLTPAWQLLLPPCHLPGNDLTAGTACLDCLWAGKRLLKQLQGLMATALRAMPRCPRPEGDQQQAKVHQLCQVQSGQSRMIWVRRCLQQEEDCGKWAAVVHRLLQLPRCLLLGGVPGMPPAAYPFPLQEGSLRMSLPSPCIHLVSPVIYLASLVGDGCDWVQIVWVGGLCSLRAASSQICQCVWSQKQGRLSALLKTQSPWLV